MTNRPLRVIHVVRAMNYGGVETWLMNLLRHTDRRRVAMDFLVHSVERGAFDSEIEQRGARILRCRKSPIMPGYRFEMASLVSGAGPYDAIHSHVHHFSGYLLRLAAGLPIPIRIAHSHSDTSRQDASSGVLRQGYLRLMESWMHNHATHQLAASDLAGRSLFGKAWRTDPRSRILHCGTDPSPFRNVPPRAEIRRTLGFAPSDFVIGHVGRFDYPKNHEFLLNIARHAIQRHPATRLLLVGDGPLRQQILEDIAKLGIDCQVILTGIRGDIPAMLAAMDVFVFPSHYEGLPLTVVEAQASGLPCLISDAISPETCFIPELVEWLPLSAGAPAWAERTVAARERERFDAERSLARLESSSFCLPVSVEALFAIYEEREVQLSTSRLLETAARTHRAGVL